MSDIEAKRLAWRTYARKRRATDPKYREYQKAYMKEYSKTYQKTPEWKAYVNRYWKERGRRDPSVRLRKAISCGISRSLRHGKGTHWETLIGYTLDDLRNHLERRFTEGMSWANYGQWHIDHIRPICTFDLEDEAQLKACWSLSNLQPLWGTDNYSKGARFETARTV